MHNTTIKATGNRPRRLLAEVSAPAPYFFRSGIRPRAMKNNILLIIMITVALILVFPDKLKEAVALRSRLRASHIPYVILVLFALFLTFVFPPPWSYPPLFLTGYAIVCKRLIYKHMPIHFIVSGVVFAVGVALASGAFKVSEIKNEVFLFNHYINITYEVGPTLFFAGAPVVFSCLWQFASERIRTNPNNPLHRIADKSGSR